MKNCKKSIILAVSLVVVGLIVGAVGLVSVNFDFTKLSLARLTANIYNVEEDFTKISIDTDISDVTLALSKGNTCQVVCLEEVNYTHKVSVENNTLTITTQDDRTWYEHIGMNIGDYHSITVWLPKKAYEELTVTCRTADVQIPKDFSFGWADITTTTGGIKWQGSMVNNLLLSVTTGDIRIDDTSCQTLTVKTDTGDIRLTNTIITESLTAKTDTGDVCFDLCDVKAMSVKTDTGDVTGTLLSNKIFVTKTDTGKIVVPTPAEGGIGQILSQEGELIIQDNLHPGFCYITTDTGDIRIKLS